MATRRRSWAPALVVLLLGGCTLASGAPAPSGSAGGSPAGDGSPSATSPPPSASRTGGTGIASASATPGRTSSATRTYSALLRLTTTARIPLAGQTYGRGIVLFGRYASWVGCDGCERTFTEPTTLYVADLTTRRVRVVATAPKNSFVAPIGGVGTRLAYLVGLTGGRSVQWAIDTVDLASGARSTVAAAKQGIADTPPAAAVGAGQLVWQTFAPGPQGGSHGPVTAVDLRSGARRTLARDLPGVLGSVIGRGLVFRAGATDAALLPTGQAQPVALSETHDVRDVVADDRTVAWQTDDGPDAAAWAAPLDRQGPAREYYRGGTGDRAVGTGFLAVVTAGDSPVLLLYPLPDGPVVAVGDIPGEFDSIAAEGSHLAYIALPDERGTQPDAKHPITLVAATVQPPGS